MKRKHVVTPAITGIGGQRDMEVFTGKAPKLRFKPGQFVSYKGSTWEIMYCYRTKDEPNVWKYTLEESKEKCGLSKMLDGICGQLTNRVVYDCFHSSMDAMMYFLDIPANGDRITVKVGELLNKTTLLSSGEILS